MLLSFLLISSLAGIFTACDDIEDEYITDTQLSILQESRTSLNYLLKNSTYGTAPGTYPETGKDILNAAIAELDALITRVEAGEELDETTLEAAVAKVNQAIDEFKNSKYYNLSPEAQQYINNLLAKADEILAIVNDETKWGNHQGQYPVENKSVLESAAKDLESLAERIKSGSITDMTQEIYDEVIAAADKKVEEVEDSAWPDNSQITWNLFVDGNAGSYIDFGYSEDYVKFGEDDNQAFTIELWVNIKEYCNRQGEDNCTFLSTMTNDPYWSGWRHAQSTARESDLPDFGRRRGDTPRQGGQLRSDCPPDRPRQQCAAGRQRPQPCRAVRQLPLPPRSQPRRPPRPQLARTTALVGTGRRPIQTQRVRGYETIPVGVLTHGHLHYFPVCVCGSIYRGRRPCDPVCLALSPYETVQCRRPVRILSMSA